MEARFVSFKPNGDRVEILLDKPSLIFGRSTECDICIPISSVSRNHCEVTIAGDQIWLADMSSANGTFVNNDKVEEVRLTAGDHVVLGPLVLTLQVDGVPSEIEPATVVAATEVAAPAEAIEITDDEEGDDLILDLADDDDDGAFALVESGDDEDGAFDVAEELGAMPLSPDAAESSDPFAVLGAGEESGEVSDEDPFGDLLGDDDDDDEGPITF